MNTLDLQNHLLKQLFAVKDEVTLRKCKKLLGNKSESTLLYYLCETQLGKVIGGHKLSKKKKNNITDDEMFQEVEKWL